MPKKPPAQSRKVYYIYSKFKCQEIFLCFGRFSAVFLRFLKKRYRFEDFIHAFVCFRCLPNLFLPFFCKLFPRKGSIPEKGFLGQCRNESADDPKRPGGGHFPRPETSEKKETG